MKYALVDPGMQAWCRAHLWLSQAQSRRISRACVALLLAGCIQLSSIARFVPSATHQDSRIRWLKRLLDATFMQPELVYQPALRQILSQYRAPTWHLAIDRTPAWDTQRDLVTVTLSCRKRAIPLLWQFVPFGGASIQTYVALVRCCAAFVPPDVQVIFHGDTEFGAVAMIQALRELGWDFILAQQGNTYFKAPDDSELCLLSALQVPRRGTLRIPNIELTRTHRLSGLNLMAFYHPKDYRHVRKRTYCYLVTSLPLTPGLRRLGRRRWGIEPFHRDLKSSGFRLTTTHITDPSRQASLLLLVALVYLYAVCLGRWVCKTGRRPYLDDKPRRHYSLFRLGWDWLVHHCRLNHPVPIMLRLYL